MTGFNVKVERNGSPRSCAWRPDYSAAMQYARTLSKTAKLGETVLVEDEKTNERKWTYHVTKR